MDKKVTQKDLEVFTNSLLQTSYPSNIVQAVVFGLQDWYKKLPLVEPKDDPARDNK